MTLKIRNNFLKFFEVFSITCILFSTVFFILGILENTILPLPTKIRVLYFPGNSFLVTNNFLATVFSLTILIFFVPVSVFFIIKFFRKTQASEIIFFICFLFGILCEIARFFIISSGIWNTFSELLLIAGKILVFGRTLTVLSFFFAALMSSANQRQAIEKNLLMLLSFSALTSLLTPINTARITSTGMITIGFSGMYSIFSILTIILSIVVFIYTGKIQGQPAFTRLATAFLKLILGYEILLNADSFIYMTIGILLLFYGTIRYLLSIHKIYIWQ